MGKRSPIARWRWVLGMILAPLYALSGGGCGVPLYGAPAYGVQPLYGMYPPQHDPTVQITDFSYSPASPAHLGDTLDFKATLNHTIYAGMLQVEIGEPPSRFVLMRDDGWTPDTIANDGIYNGELEWKVVFGPVVGEPVNVQLSWYDETPGLERQGPPLSVEE